MWSVQAVVALAALVVTAALNLLGLGVLWGKLTQRLSHQDEELKELKARGERTESLLAGLATKVEVRFATEAAGRPRRRKRS